MALLIYLFKNLRIVRIFHSSFTDVPTVVKFEIARFTNLVLFKRYPVESVPNLFVVRSSFT